MTIVAALLTSMASTYGIAADVTRAQLRPHGYPGAARLAKPAGYGSLDEDNKTLTADVAGQHYSFGR